jgi:PleD family two-component response regulator
METGVVVALVKDLFFSVKIKNELAAHGYTPVFARSTEQFGALLRERQPALGLIDLGAGVDWSQVKGLGQDPATAEVPILVFGSHKDVDGFRAAKAAGVTRVVSNGQMHANLPSLVAKYARS